MHITPHTKEVVIMKKIYRMYISFVMLFILVLTPNIAFAESSPGIQLPDFNITINGVSIENDKLEYPFITYNNITYFPMTWDFCSGMGLGTSYDAVTGLIITSSKSQENLNIVYASSSIVEKDLMASIPTFPVTVNGKLIEMSKEEYPLLLFNDITYFPLTWRFTVEEFGWKSDWDAETGLGIDSIVDSMITQPNLNDNAKWGYIDREGNMVIEPQFDIAFGTPRVRLYQTTNFLANSHILSN
jgi:hypothetical protein